MTVKMGGPMPPMPMGGIQQPLNPLPRPMPVPPINPNMQFGQQPVGALPAQAAGTAPVAPMTRSNAGRRRRFGDRLESMLASNQPPVASDQMAGMNVFTGQMPRRQMMGGTAIQSPVRRMMGGGAVPIPRKTDIYGQPHMLAYINPEEADLLKGLGGMGTPGPGGVPQYNWFSDFISSITGGGKSSNTGGRNNPRGGSSSSPSYASPSNDPYAEDRGGRSSGPGFDPSAPPDTGGYFDDPKPSKPSTPAYDFSVSPGDDRPTVTVSTTPTYGIPSNSESNTGGYDEIPMPSTPTTPSSPTGGYDEVPVITPPVTVSPPNTGVIGGYDPIGGGSVDDGGVGSGSGVIGGYDPIGGGSVDDVGIGAPPNTGVIGGYDPIGGGSKDDVGIGAPPSTPGTGGGDDDDDGGVNLEPIFYDMFGNPYKTQAEADAADAEYLRKQQAAADAEAERKRMEQFAELERQAAEEAARAQAAREKIARQAAAEAEMGLDPFGGTGGPDDPLYVSDVFEYIPDYKDPRGDEANVMTNYLPDDPINTGLGDISLNPPERPKGGGEEEDDDRSFLEKLVDDVKAVPGNIIKDLTMAKDAGFFSSYEKMIENLKNAKNPDGTPKYTQAEIDDYIKRTKETQQKQRDQQERESAQDGDDPKPVVGDEVVDPCPTGFKLDPASGICVPIEDTEEEEDSGDDKEEDTSDDELSGVVRLPPPPTSYLDNAPMMMKRGGSVGLNRAADNFLAAMGA